ncbi:hypothetical protein KKI34_14365 [Pseudoalteromonas tetraodonis]|uniref:hypothetical protein n=1 Tax=Pseudoalteromonas tetraodonis TaxID=43659 RepID=UPI001BDE3A30|nr:hypothetical protein [Pseudoalteromonas tetraodonis]MBT2152925.1 hypothetical protein [Pseudoalteromonas tetraodonis]
MKFSVISVVKNRLTNLPYPLGKLASYLPFTLRPGVGKVYSQRKVDIEVYAGLNEAQRKQFIFDRVKSLVLYAYENIPFYKELYDSKDFKPNSLVKFEDIKRIPVICKADLKNYRIDERVNPSISSYLENTGGSSGNPLELMIEPSSVGHEWAHMHNVWGKLGFKPSDLRIVFSGRSTIKDVVQYDSARHQLNVDIYAGWQVVADKLLETFSRYKPNYLHGYPSAIFDFVLWLESKQHPLLETLKDNIDGMMLGSEFPNPSLRDKVENLLSCESVSWYGHTERCVLAYESEEKQVYKPFPTYGYAEAVDVEGEVKLVATSYYNYAHPLIRYNTEDGIEPLNNHLILDSFTISKGRDGDFILDQGGNKIFLTGLIFGRHHKLFDYCTNLQVYQNEPGHALILYVPRVGFEGEPEELFDVSSVALEFSFGEIAEPYKTKSGKTPLLVKEL